MQAGGALQRVAPRAGGPAWQTTTPPSPRVRGATNDTSPHLYIYCRGQRTLVTDRVSNESARPLSTWTTEPCWTEQMIPLPVPTSASGCCDGAGAYTPTEVADNVLRCIAESQAAQPPMHFFAFVDEKDVRQQAALSTARCNAPAPCQYTTCRNARCE